MIYRLWMLSLALLVAGPADAGDLGISSGSPRLSFEGGAGGGGGTGEEWALFTGPTIEGASPFDPSGLANPIGTSYDSTTGLFTVVTSASALVRDGYRDLYPRWSVAVTTLYPDYDPINDTVDLAWIPVGVYPANGDGWGVSLNLMDGPAADTATQLGASSLVYASGGGTRFTWASATPTILAGSVGIIPGLTPQIAGFRVSFSYSEGFTQLYGKYHETVGGIDEWRYTAVNAAATTGTPFLAADSYIQVGFPHANSNVSAGEIWTGYLYSRVVVRDPAP